MKEGMCAIVCLDNSTAMLKLSLMPFQISNEVHWMGQELTNQINVNKEKSDYTCSLTLLYKNN